MVRHDHGHRPLFFRYKTSGEKRMRTVTFSNMITSLVLFMNIQGHQAFELGIWEYHKILCIGYLKLLGQTLQNSSFQKLQQ